MDKLVALKKLGNLRKSKTYPGYRNLSSYNPNPFVIFYQAAVGEPNFYKRGREKILADWARMKGLVPLK